MFYKTETFNYRIVGKGERQCILMLDEMHVSQSYEYCDRLKGQTSYGRNPKESFHNTAYSVQLPYIVPLKQMFTPHKKVKVVLLR